MFSCPSRAPRSIASSCPPAPFSSFSTSLPSPVILPLSEIVQVKNDDPSMTAPNPSSSRVPGLLRLLRRSRREDELTDFRNILTNTLSLWPPTLTADVTSDTQLREEVLYLPMEHRRTVQVLRLD